MAIAVAKNFFALNILNNAKIIHRYTTPMVAVLRLIGKNKLLDFISLFSTYRNGAMKILQVINVPHIPFLPNLIIGINTNHAKIIELIG